MTNKLPEEACFSPETMGGVSLGEPVDLAGERWPDYNEQSWKERFTELDRRYSAVMKLAINTPALIQKDSQPDLQEVELPGFTIRHGHLDRIWIERNEGDCAGEGMDAPIEVFTALVEQYYEDNF